MKEVIIGTTNPAKVEQIKGALEPLKILVRGIGPDTPLPKVEEDGQTALENARKKALAYSKALNKPVLSMDNALYLEGLSTEEQPGLNVRRVKSRSGSATDEEMILHYSTLILRLGGRVQGYWEFGICIATPRGDTREITIISPRIFLSRPSQKIIPGYPLEALQVEIESGRYISEMSKEEQALFWQKAIGEKLMQFVQSVDF